jgi:hypothetical protein
MVIDDALRKRIEDVLHKYTPKAKQAKPDFESRLASAVTKIVAAKAAANRSLPRKFRNIGRNETAKELEEFAAGLEKAVDAIDRMHYPARSRLAMAGLGPAMHLRSRLEAMRKSVCDIGTGEVPENPKRRVTRSRHALIFTLGKLYRDFSGKKPRYSKRQGGFLLFVFEMFEVIQEEEPSKHEVQMACKLFDE